MQIELELEERTEGSEVSLRCRTFLRIHDVGLAENACRCVAIRTTDIPFLRGHVHMCYPVCHARGHRFYANDSKLMHNVDGDNRYGIVKGTHIVVLKTAGHALSIRVHSESLATGHIECDPNLIIRRTSSQAGEAANSGGIGTWLWPEESI